MIFDILSALVQRSEKQMLRNIHTFALKGGEPEILFQNLMENVRDLMILKLNPKNTPALVQASETELERLSRIGEWASYEDLHLIFDMLLKAERELAFCHDRHLALEVLLLRLSQAPRVESIAPFQLSDISSPDEKKPLADEDGVSGKPGAVNSASFRESAEYNRDFGVYQAVNSTRFGNRLKGRVSLKALQI